ncbi:MAG TPA: PD-(D/E)XK nuclease family protein [Bacillota bacterium]|nr:PD-(D/E)XK nuclease family protein [Bacillota bacterium]
MQLATFDSGVPDMKSVEEEITEKRTREKLPTVQATTKPLLSFSQISTYLRCRQEWWYVYQENLVPRVDARPLSLGSAVHMGLATALREYYYGTMPVEDGVRKGVESWKERELARDDLFEEEIEAIHQVGADAEQIAIRTLRKLPIDEWETVVDPAGIPMIEYHFTIPLKGWGGFHGYIDWVGRHKPTDQIWLVDWKVRGSFQPYEAEEVNLQNAAYQYAIFRILRKPPVGTITFQISDKSPAKPKLNKDGTMSRALIKTDWETYKAALLEAGLNPDDYLDMAEKLSTVEFFRPAKEYRTLHTVRQVWKGVVEPTAREIRRSNKIVVRNLGYRTCNGCAYRQLCLAELSGEDAGYIRETHYRLHTGMIDKFQEKEDEENAL